MDLNWLNFYKDLTNLNPSLIEKCNKKENVARFIVYYNEADITTDLHQQKEKTQDIQCLMNVGKSLKCLKNISERQYGNHLYLLFVINITE